MREAEEHTALSRRRFIAGTAAGGLMIVPRRVLGGPGYTAPSDRINVACVGAGGQAAWNIGQLKQAGEDSIVRKPEAFSWRRLIRRG